MRRRRSLLFTCLIFAVLSFAPVVNGGEKLGWLPRWMAYPALVSCLAARKWADLALLSSVVIVGHVGLSLGFGATLGWLVSRMTGQRDSN